MTENPAEIIARLFHEKYEAMAPAFDYDTRPESAVAWEDVPENNKRLMIAVVRSLINNGIIEPGPKIDVPRESYSLWGLRTDG